MGNYTKQDIIQLVEEKDVQFIRLQFTDVSGTLKNVAITASQLEKALDNKCMFDGSSIEGFVRIEESTAWQSCPFHVRCISTRGRAFRGRQPLCIEKCIKKSGKDGIYF